MAKKTYVLVLDTETANTHDEDGKLDMRDSQVYDCGFVVADLKGNIYEKHSYIIKETFFDKALMDSAYYANKVPAYWRDIWNGERDIITLNQLRSIIFEVCRRWGIRAVVAHNARFDRNALNATIRYNTCSMNRFFLPYGVEVWDTMQMAGDTICQMKKYKRFCEDNGFMTNHRTPRPRRTAEVLYRFITQDIDFKESHTGLEDVLIETAIMAECFRKHQKMRKEI